MPWIKLNWTRRKRRWFIGKLLHYQMMITRIVWGLTVIDFLLTVAWFWNEKLRNSPKCIIAFFPHNKSVLIFCSPSSEHEDDDDEWEGLNGNERVMLELNYVLLQSCMPLLYFADRKCAYLIWIWCHCIKIFAPVKDKSRTASLPP